MTGMYRWSMMIYNDPYAKFNGTKHTHRNGASIFSDIIVSVSKLINEEK